MTDVDHGRTEPTSTASTAPEAPAAPLPITAGHRWLLLGAAVWLVTGLQLDAWAHANVPKLESFWTPWHAVLYSGIAACGLTLLRLVRLSLPPGRPDWRVVAALPLRPHLAGMALLLVGGAIDTLWHNIFGIEKGLEIFASPSHIMIIVGMVLVASGPARLVWIAPGGRRLRPPDAALVLLSTLLTVVPLHIFTLHATVLVRPKLGTGLDPMPVQGLDALALHGYIASTVLLVIPIATLGRRWALPYGIGPVLVGLPSLLMWTAFSGFRDAWYPWTVAGAAVLAELVLRAGHRLVDTLPADARWLLFGAAAPVIVWGVVLLVGAQRSFYGWDVHTTTGLLALTALLGAGTAFVVRRLQV
jgi:hypothetical protein